MPSHTAHSALTRLHFTPGNEGAPWNFAAWQEMTGIKHGLFPKDDRLLPPTWTRRNSDDVQSYFLEYQSKKSEHDKLEFSAARRASGHDSTPGRAFFRDWVTAHWASIWKVNSRITKVLIDAGLHPMQILSDNDTLDVLPASSSYLPLSIDEIGRELYGTGPGITDAGGRLVGSLREPTMIMAQRAWQNNMSGVGKKKKKLEDLNEQARDSLKVLHAGQITVQTIRKAIRTVANFGKAVEACPTTGFSREVARLEEELRPFIPEDNHDAKGKASSDGKPILFYPATLVLNRCLLTASATPEEIQQLYAEYDTWYGAGQDADGPDDFSFDNAALAPEFNLSDGIHDPGVEFEAKMSYSQLANRLGFKDGVPSLLFNTVRHIGGENTWSDRFEEIVTSDPDAIEPFALLWHQLGGIHAILRNVLGKEPSSSACRGMLIADDVGLGKTVQSAATIAFLAEASVVQERNLTPKLPQILVDCPYLGESQTIEPLPHLIIVPGTLMAQWEHELKCFFRWKFVDVLLYKSGLKAHREFFRPDGHFLSSPYPPSHRIVIASLSALQQDFGQLYGKERHLGSLPWENPVPLPTFTASRPYTLFGHRWMTCVIDEAQGVRNIGRKHFAALTLLEQATVRLILTATPLQTSTKDLAAMGRLIGLEHFFSQVSHSEQASDATSLRRAKQDREDMLEVPEPDEDPILLAQHQISARLQTKFEGRVIRRTAASLNHNGKPLLPLTPFTSTQLIARLTERELAILEKITQDDADDAGTAAARGNAGSKFYLEHRMGVTWPRPRGEVVPTFDTLAAWEENGSTKIKLLVSVIRHILSRDDMPLIYLDNDEIVFPPAPDSLQLSQTVKAVVYMEFPIFIGLVKSVFALHGIKGLAISGRTTMEQRSSIVRKFNNDAEHRVLIFSKVGSTGLNLTRASYVVLLDQPWSAQDEHQIVGRVWRQKQKRHVQAIHLLAADTADITLAGMALGKKAMLDSFLTTQSSKGQLRSPMSFKSRGLIHTISLQISSTS
ncbi:P-loop containing nucleoside triphosphate hydrolase protein [Coprinopsis sp. MPI-PUGE-AT-0042]|nr:P-loop containing nucleoside triphosphate hydrolase protein [Coprinopsis sp. MPI-PUGE-AT-0042]